jgi:hypothetical protein
MLTLLCHHIYFPSLFNFIVFLNICVCKALHNFNTTLPLPHSFFSRMYDESQHIDDYLRDAFQEGRAGSVACLPVPRAAEVFSFFLRFACWSTLLFLVRILSLKPTRIASVSCRLIFAHSATCWQIGDGGARRRTVPKFSIADT